MAAHIRCHTQMFAVPKKAERFITECGESRKPSQQTDKEEQAQLGAYQLARFRHSGQQSDDETSDGVDDEGAVRKGAGRDRTVYRTADSIAQDRSDEAAGSDQGALHEPVQFHGEILHQVSVGWSRSDVRIPDTVHCLAVTEPFPEFIAAFEKQIKLELSLCPDELQGTMDDYVLWCGEVERDFPTFR